MQRTHFRAKNAKKWPQIFYIVIFILKCRSIFHPYVVDSSLRSLYVAGISLSLSLSLARVVITQIKTMKKKNLEILENGRMMESVNGIIV
jgi:hypothetical protein